MRSHIVLSMFKVGSLKNNYLSNFLHFMWLLPRQICLNPLLVDHQFTGPQNKFCFLQCSSHSQLVAFLATPAHFLQTCDHLLNLASWQWNKLVSNKYSNQGKDISDVRRQYFFTTECIRAWRLENLWSDHEKSNSLDAWKRERKVKITFGLNDRTKAH